LIYCSQKTYSENSLFILCNFREDRLVFWHAVPVPITSDCIVVLSSKGDIIKKVHIYDLIKDYIPFSCIADVYGSILEPVNLMRIFYNKLTKGFACAGTGIGTSDLMHTNSIEIMDKNITSFCKKYDWLISVSELDLVIIVDAEKEACLWSWGPGELQKQHHPTLLKNGNLLIFDNGTERGFSRIVELDPLNKKIVWEYISEPPEKFFSAIRGACQRLPNGNTLVTESDKGHVFEISKDGKIVWEFYNPNTRERNKEREAIYRMLRIADFEK